MLGCVVEAAAHGKPKKKPNKEQQHLLKLAIPTQTIENRSFSYRMCTDVSPSRWDRSDSHGNKGCVRQRWVSALWFRCLQRTLQFSSFGLFGKCIKCCLWLIRFHRVINASNVMYVFSCCCCAFIFKTWEEKGVGMGLRNLVWILPGPAG